MDRTRAALFLDFDNVFSGLFRLDPRVAVDFAEQPEIWLERLRGSHLVDAPRRWLVLRCYLNPTGTVRAEDGAKAAGPFSRYRTPFVRAGFEVVDCPRLTHTKNAADIRMALDAADLMRAQPACEEFVIASGDSDMTPLLQRLRAADRRTTVISPSDAARAFTAVAERLIAADEVLALVEGDCTDSDADMESAGPGPQESDGGSGPVEEGQTGDPAYLRLRDLVIKGYNETSEPLNLSALASEMLQAVPEASAGDGRERWFGATSFLALLAKLPLAGAEYGQHHLWDRTRHRDPDAATFEEAPAVIREISADLGLQRLARGSWSSVHQVLAEYAATHEFNLSESSRWSRDRLNEQGIRISRAAISTVVRGSAHGGAPLHHCPPPTADQIAEAFVANIRGRVAASDRELKGSEVAAVRAWFTA